MRARKQVATYEFRVIDDSGEVRWVEGFSSPDRVRASENYLIGVNRDITERRQSELELSEAKLQADRVLAELEIGHQRAPCTARAPARRRQISPRTRSIHRAPKPAK